MNEKTLQIKKEICKAIIGKDDVVEKVLTAIIAGGHILLEDIPGVGKTTLHSAKQWGWSLKECNLHLMLFPRI